LKTRRRRTVMPVLDRLGTQVGTIGDLLRPPAEAKTSVRSGCALNRFAGRGSQFARRSTSTSCRQFARKRLRTEQSPHKRLPLRGHRGELTLGQAKIPGSPPQSGPLVSETRGPNRLVGNCLTELAQENRSILRTPCTPWNHGMKSPEILCNGLKCRLLRVPTVS
jgi:hypothetical protein